MGVAGGSHWTDYWRQGHLTSLPGGFAANYDGEFLRFWNEQFAVLKTGGCVLDVCSGNGSIALLAQEFSRREDRHLKIIAINAADINVSSIIKLKPELAQHLQAIHFIPNTLLEEMQAPSESVDLVASQYGVEYADWKLAATNINRVLKCGGHFSLICHALDSRIMVEMERQHSDYEWLSGLGILLKDFALPGDEASRTAFLDALYEGAQAVLGESGRRKSEMLRAVGARLEQIRQFAAREPKAALAIFLQLRDGLKTGHAIAGDLVGVTYALRQFPDWHTAFIEEGLQLITSGDIRYRTGEIAGKFYRFRKGDR